MCCNLGSNSPNLSKASPPLSHAQACSAFPSSFRPFPIPPHCLFNGITRPPSFFLLHIVKHENIFYLFFQFKLFPLLNRPSLFPFFHFTKILGPSPCLFFSPPAPKQQNSLQFSTLFQVSVFPSGVPLFFCPTPMPKCIPPPSLFKFPFLLGPTFVYLPLFQYWKTP